MLGFARAAGAQTIIDQWSTATPPSPPPLKAVAVDSKTSALLVLDFLKQNCPSNPRCVAAVPHVASLLAAARAKGVFVVYSAFPGAAMTDTLPDVAPLASEATVLAPADKFIDPKLDQILKAKGIKTLVVCGTAANGAAMFTAGEAALRGYNVVAPLDCIPGRSPYIEQYVAYQLSVLPGAADHVTLTQSSMVTF
jgi:nicotinamidase-related amidase